MFCVSLDKMKDAIIAKLANQAADFYGDAFKQCQYKENLPKVRKLAVALAGTHACTHAHSTTQTHTPFKDCYTQDWAHHSP